MITTIPDGVWRTMVGRSWHRGCPLGRSGLRLLRINYWGFDGYRYRGEMVLSAAVASRAAAALRDMYDGRYPIRRMYRVDRFGWSQSCTAPTTTPRCAPTTPRASTAAAS